MAESEPAVQHPGKPADTTDATPAQIRDIVSLWTQEELVDALSTLSTRIPEVLATIKEIADKDPRRRKMFIRNLDFSTTKESLRGLFEAFGQLEEAVVILNKDGKSKGFGFVKYATAEGAAKALEQPVKQLDGRSIICNLAVNKEKDIHSNPQQREQPRDYRDHPDYSRDRDRERDRDYRNREWEHRGYERDFDRGFDRSGGMAGLGMGGVGIGGVGMPPAPMGFSQPGGYQQHNFLPQQPSPLPAHPGDRPIIGNPPPQPTLSGDTTFTKLFVRSLAFTTTSETLHSFFSQYGTVQEAVVLTNKDTGTSKGFGFVTFADSLSAQRSLAEPTKNLDGRTVHCKLAAAADGKPFAPPMGSQMGQPVQNPLDMYGAPNQFQMLNQYSMYDQNPPGMVPPWEAR